MSTATIPTTASGDDFDKWEREFTAPSARSYRPTRAAQRRADDEEIDRGLGINRHRRYDRREA